MAAIFRLIDPGIGLHRAFCWLFGHRWHTIERRPYGRIERCHRCRRRQFVFEKVKDWDPGAAP